MIMKQLHESKKPKTYVKPVIETIKLHPDERIATCSPSCAAIHGTGQGCANEIGQVPGGPV
jgi:hypothetical protein